MNGLAGSELNDERANSLMRALGEAGQPGTGLRRNACKHMTGDLAKQGLGDSSEPMREVNEEVESKQLLRGQKPHGAAPVGCFSMRFSVVARRFRGDFAHSFRLSLVFSTFFLRRSFLSCLHSSGVDSACLRSTPDAGDHLLGARQARRTPV